MSDEPPTPFPPTVVVGRWRTCCLPFDRCIRSRWTGLGVGFAFVFFFILICFLMSPVWSALLFRNCDVLQGTSTGGRCALSLIYIVGLPVVIGVYVLFLPVLLYRIGRRNEEKDKSDDLEEGPYEEAHE